MKFRYKILIVNIVILSVSLGIVGYFMIRRNFDLSRETQLKNAITENNLVQASVEYELLEKMNQGEVLQKGLLQKIGERVMEGLVMGDSAFYIRYDAQYVYSGGGEEQIPEELFDRLTIGGKNYMICEDAGAYLVYVTSYSEVDGKPLCVVSRQDISETYRMLEEQIGYFRLLILGVVAFASIIVYLLCKYLTRPLEELNRATAEIAEGQYDTHVKVKGQDEVGQLAESVNCMADAVQERVEELQDMVRRREQFVADFTHEIKTPITTIIACADMVRSMELPREEQIRALTYVFSEGKRLERMSAKLFELIYLKQQKLELGTVNTKNLERDIIRITTPILESKNIRLVTDVEEGLLQGDTELLNTVFLNLIDNARKASAEGSWIHLTGRKLTGSKNREEEKGYTREPLREHVREQIQKPAPIYQWEVSDHGIGMSPEELAHICDEFYMADKARTRKEGGAGLGLSLTALILQKHKAKLEAHSTVGKGTVMKVIFYEA